MQTNTSHLLEPSNASFLDYAGASTDDVASIPTDSLLSLRVCISICYCLVCTAGLLGNGLVMYLIRARKARGPSPVDVFVFCLALADFQLSLTLPFWAVDTLSDFSWPFGNFMCKIVLSVTVLNIYATAFLLTAMSVTRYWSVASAVSPRFRLSARSARWITLGLWVAAAASTIPTAVFARTVPVNGEELCLLRFPEPRWLGLYHLHKIVVAFVIPLVTITCSYVMLCSFLDQHYLQVKKLGRQGEVTNSILLLVVGFFICWFPNHAATFWGVLMKFGLVNWSWAYYYFHLYVFPVTICLAHSSSCLNPILYYLMRRECRKALKTSLCKMATHFFSCLPTAGPKQSQEHTQAAVPLNPRQSLSCPPQPIQRGRKKCPLTSTLESCRETFFVWCRYVAMSLCLCRFVLKSLSFVWGVLFSLPYPKKNSGVGCGESPSTAV
ncbi:relaxin-3 receptor 2 [Rhinatrema bivittatum]|uniref:relaxin-3 receptor 2 n=1 Tax=Rhinatrema bivittatum TaxID=194408 RepID=UPI00112EB873|nr:relaxin-3 receptor 2 [Rhinatrema bivittatum]